MVDHGAGEARVPDGPPVPTGTAQVVGFEHADDLIGAMIAATHAGLEAAIAERLWRQGISDRGDAAATLFLDRARVEALLQGPPGEPPAELARLRAQADRRARSLLRRLEATPDHGPPLARAVRRWQLPSDAIRILAAMVATELAPRLARLAAFAGGDASRPGVIVEAIGALLGVEEAGVSLATRQLLPGGPLHDLALVLLRAPEAPLLRRTLWLAPRTIELALGRLAIDDATGATLVAPPPRGSMAPAGTATGDPPRAAALAVLRRTPAPIIGVVRGGRAGTLAALARVLDDAGAQLLAVELSSLAEDARLFAIAREAALLDAAVAVRVDVVARDAARAARAIDRLAALAPVILVTGDQDPVLPVAAGALPIALPPPGPAELAAAVGGAFAELLTPGEVERVVAHAPLDLGAILRAAAAVAAQPLPADRVAAVIRALADQTGREPTGVRRDADRRSMMLFASGREVDGG